MNKRLGSAMWLVLTSAAWVFTALLAAGALVMSPMIFTSQKVVPLGNSNWEVEFMYPAGHVVFNY